MGFMVSIEADNGGNCPEWFTKSDSKSFANALLQLSMSEPPDPLAALAAKFNLDLMPLTRFAGQDFGIEDYLAMCPTREEAEYQFNLANQQNEDAWQEPDVWIACLESITRVLDRNPQAFSAATVSGERRNSYVTGGHLQQDIKDLLHIIKWHQANGAGRVRLVIA